MEGATSNAGGGFRPGQQLRPLSIGEVLDAAIKLYTKNFVNLLKIVAIVIIPVAVITYVVIAATLPSGAFVSGGTLYTPNGTLGATGTVVEIVLSVLAALIVEGALAISLVDAYIGQPIDWRESLREATGRLGALLWVAILVAVGVTIGFILLIVPGIYLAVVWTVAVPALMFEHLSGFKALGRSYELVRGRWWATFAALFVAVIMLGIILFVVGLIFGGIESAVSIGSIGGWLVLRWFSTVVGDLIAFPFMASVIAVMYIDLRVRKEALDLELLAGALGRGGGGATASAPTIVGGAGLPGSGLGTEPPPNPPPPPEPTWPPAG